jgi:hypothetical protein
VRNGTSWSQQQKLLPLDVVNGDLFRTSVAIDGDTIVAGAPAKTIGIAGRGAAYVFVRRCTNGNFVNAEMVKAFITAGE